jgi:flagellar secretion chaperone FliS
MSGYAAAVKQAYTEAAVTTATPERLVVMLYEGALRFLARGSAAMRAGDVRAADKALRQATAIVDELNLSLDMSQGDIADRLRSIYLFCKRRLTDASIHGDAEAIEGVVRLLAELHEAWEHIADNPGSFTPASVPTLRTA